MRGSHSGGKNTLNTLGKVLSRKIKLRLGKIRLSETKIVNQCKININSLSVSHAFACYCLMNFLLLTFPHPTTPNIAFGGFYICSLRLMTNESKIVNSRFLSDRLLLTEKISV